MGPTSGAGLDRDKSISGGSGGKTGLSDLLNISAAKAARRSSDGGVSLGIVALGGSHRGVGSYLKGPVRVNVTMA